MLEMSLPIDCFSQADQLYDQMLQYVRQAPQRRVSFLPPSRVGYDLRGHGKTPLVSPSCPLRWLKSDFVHEQCGGNPRRQCLAEVVKARMWLMY